MKNKILIKGCAYLIIVFCLCQLLNVVFPSKAIVIQRGWVSDIMNSKDSIQSLTFGRSHGLALNYDDWDYKGKNLSLGGEDIASIKYSLEYFVPKLKNLKEVLISISYSSFYFDNEALSNGNLNDARKALYASIPSFKLVSAKDYDNMVFGKMFAFMHADYGFEEFQNLVKGKKDESPEHKQTVLDSIQIVESAQTQAFDHSKDKTIALEYNPHVKEDYINYLKEIVLFLKLKNIKCVFFTPPYYKDYTALYPAKDIEETDTSIKEICSETGASYYNFSKFEKVINSVSFFSNADHVNESGRHEFTRAFNEVLRKKDTDISSLNGVEITQ